MSKTHKNNKSNTTILAPTGQGFERAVDNGLKILSPEELSNTALDWRTRTNVILLLGASPVHLQAEYAQFLAKELRMAQLLSSSDPSTPTRVLTQEEVDQVLSTKYGGDPRFTQQYGQVSIAITAANKADLAAFHERLPDYCVECPYGDEKRLTFQKVVPLEVRGERLSAEEIIDVIESRWCGCSEARGGHFWDDHYLFRVDLNGGPDMIAKLTERLGINLRVEIWDSETRSQVDYVQNVDGTVKKMRTFGFKFTDDSFSCVYDGLKERLFKQPCALI